MTSAIRRPKAGITRSGLEQWDRLRSFYGDNRGCNRNQSLVSETHCASMAYAAVRCPVPRADPRRRLLSTASALRARKDAAAPECCAAVPVPRRYGMGTFLLCVEGRLAPQRNEAARPDRGKMAKPKRCRH